MKPGRELDALVAEKIFRLVGIGYYGPTKPHGGHLDQVKCATWAEAKALYDQHWPAAAVRDHVHEDIHHWKEGWGTLYIPEYSTEIADAWEVFGAVNQMVFSRRRRFWDAVAEEAYRKTKLRVAYPDVFTVLYGDMPAAICRAALAAAGPQPPETL